MKRLTDKRFTKSGFVAISSEERKKLYIPTLEEVYAKLAEYEDAEENGMLIRLPCKKGDTVYLTDYIKVREEKIENIRLSIETETQIFNEWEFGREVFFTREEAEEHKKATRGMR